MAGERERDVDELRALARELAQRVTNRAFHALLHARDEELLRHPAADILHAAVEIAPQVFLWKRHRRRVVRILAEERLAHDGAILDAVRERPDLVERRRERDD